MKAFFCIPFLPFIALSTSAFADGPGIERFVVYGKQEYLIGDSLSASEGVIGFGDIQQRPTLRAGEVLEFIPGMVVTQHSGSGKANQYFLRGFNLDHGTDFSTSLNGMPVNMRTHGHGQGYTDLNFIIPEFINRIDYQKGPYQGTQGDFSSAGSANFSLMSKLQSPAAKVEVGENGYIRGVVGNNFATEKGNLALGAEWQQYDGPWTDVNEDINKTNVFASYQQVVAGGNLNVTFLGYDNSWSSADQIPSRAVNSGQIDPLGSLDTTVGGDSNRYSVSANWQNTDWLISAFAISSDLDLYSNFTYFLEDPVNGDQFEQVDNRNTYGGNITRVLSVDSGDSHFHQTFGLDLQIDDIAEVGLYKTKARERLSTVRTDSVNEWSASLFYTLDAYLGDKWIANAAIRHDYLAVDVSSDLALNSGDASDSMTNFKAGLSYLINDQWQAYANLGQSFHSNDARGVVISVDPVTLEAAEPVDLLVRGQGAELGLRVSSWRAYSMSLSLWWLENDSELVFVGDAGSTEASRASIRKGIEFASNFWISRNLTTDIELAWTHSRFSESAVDEGDHIDGALPFVASVGVNWQINQKLKSNLRVRHFGKRTLDSFNQTRSDSFTVVNANAQYQIDNWQIALSVLNLLDSDHHDIDYLYTSRLPNEAAEGVEDVHYHPIEPRTLRLGVSYQF
ncbi:TonB-dependent receptor [Paraglaciecola aquimarina]|uniref:TonB-dependent receptor n=1 Tax=Paraglaciecola algarum TaxID=3050085 RepID=A0ABS9D500_9ALTE|nr:TonB-dependent receptor [Paraglaciecola sp. G1-23]MCF2948028.1 TonB-dependent receptor [Paraglaciecola sp. G1-23]